MSKIEPDIGEELFSFLQISSMKTYKIRGRTYKDGRDSWIDLKLEFEGKRAFAVWDTVVVGNYALKARFEIDPKKIRPGSEEGDFEYRGELVVPVPENN
jgi:hypothetical protein